MKLLNVGCGSHHHPNWTNLDLVTAAPGVVEHDLPFPVERLLRFRLGGEGDRRGEGEEDEKESHGRARNTGTPAEGFRIFNGDRGRRL